MFTIRRAELQDAENISHLVRTLLPFFTIHADGRGAELFLETVSIGGMTQILQSDDFRYFVAENDNGQGHPTLAGVVALRRLNGRFSHVYHWFVAPAFHGQGLGRQLWQFILDDAVQTSDPERLTVNASVFAHPLYRHYGFVDTAERQEQHGLAFIPMELKIR